MRYVPELYFKSPDEMREIFRDFPEAITNTLEIADRCNLEIEFGKSKYPEYPVPEGKTRERLFARALLQGLARTLRRTRSDRPGINQATRLRTRCSRENGFCQLSSSSFGILSISPRSEAFRSDPGRGSAAGSIVAYVLGITDIDPLQYGLIFERFLNPDRISPPDIDVDFCEARRGEVLEYVRQKYGERRVAQIITFGQSESARAWCAMSGA